MVTALLVIAILVLLIVVHELGHFFAAKFFRVKVEEFGIGYPPRAFSFGTWGGTEYTLNWIPFGGFVRLFGESRDGEHGRGSLVDSAKWKQAVILVAGVAMNALCAWLLISFAIHAGVPRAVESVSSGQHAQLLVSSVIPASPADVAGLKAGDEIIGLRDKKGIELATLTPERMVDFVTARGGVELTLTYLHDGTQKEAIVIPANAIIPGAEGRAGIGVALALVTIEPVPLGEALREGYRETLRSFVLVGTNLQTLFVGALHGRPNLSDVVGPVGIVSYVGQASQNGIGSVLFLAGLISVNLVIINLLPIPSLDGGRLVIVAIEAATRRRAPKLAVQLVNVAGIALILLLMVVVTYHDVVRLFV